MLWVIALTGTAGWMAGRFQDWFGVAPILGALLCAACFLRPRDLLIVGIGAILLRDLWLGFSLFTLVRVAAVAAAGGVLIALKVRPTRYSLPAGLFLSTAAYHLTLAVGDWWTATCSLLPRTPQGFWASLLEALPFIRRALVGDLCFAALFLAAYALALCAVQPQMRHRLIS